ncbi:hypothetical protein AQUCO_02700105v1 [Aquilegia coerulea]|uniref:Thaumatin-like protein n=1 Tax=Aquilegia coerulea TaxID=218851 RepID=A0A2G5D573_AQUCA|nr:hypothetical protein AQUCO_02700105v1 [Aquilegia coerulea]
MPFVEANYFFIFFKGNRDSVMVFKRKMVSIAEIAVEICVQLDYFPLMALIEDVDATLSMNINKIETFLRFQHKLWKLVLSATFTLKNNCPHSIWPGTLTGGGQPQLSTTGFELKTGESQTITAPPKWSGRFWARTLCSNQQSGKFTCATADCASGQIECKGAGAIPPATLAEFTLGGAGDQDFYDVSLVDGYNLPLSIAPQGKPGCSLTSCPADINKICPPEMVVKGPGDTNVVACKSACEAFKDPKYCCAKPYDTPDTCPPSAYSMMFKKSCPQAYSYAYDDKTSTFTCITGGDYLITFCP